MAEIALDTKAQRPKAAKRQKTKGDGEIMGDREMSSSANGRRRKRLQKYFFF